MQRSQIVKIMKKTLLIALLSILSFQVMKAQQAVGIKFDKISHNFGSFSEKDATQQYTFIFTNTGEKPLVINQVVPSCGCTVADYTKKPVMPGQKGEIKITYKGQGRMPGHFKKTITVRSNGVPEMTRLYIEGDMTEDTSGR